MSAPDHANAPARGGLRVGTAPHNTARVQLEAGPRASPAPHVLITRWSACAWGAIGATTVFVALTCWWLTQDRSIPIFDAGDQLETVFEYHSLLQAGDLLGPFTHKSVYPILGQLVGALAVFVGGVNVASPIVGENLVFVPVLALGCYQTGRLLFGSLAGMLAVFFVLGSPLLISLFHVFLLDAQVAALVAVSVWLILASEDFSRPRIAGLAGLAVGLGFNIKVQFALFVIGLTIIVLLHGGWRNWRGFAVFAGVAMVVGLPWYIAHAYELGRMLELASSGPGTPPGNIPPTLSTVNLTWYLWSVLNSQLLVTLFIFAVVGALWTFVTVVRDIRGQAARLEFLAAGFVAWLIITFATPHHDTRYGLPLLVFVSVIATGWIAHLPRRARLVAIVVLVLGVSANTLGDTFGVGREVSVAVGNALPGGDHAIVFTPHGFLVAGPTRDGDVPGLLGALRREGVRTVAWSIAQSPGPEFSFEGLLPLARIAELVPAVGQGLEYSHSASTATLIHEAVTAGSPPTCTRLSDGTGVWVARYDLAAGKLALYCPTRHPQFYDIGAVR